MRVLFVVALLCASALSTCTASGPRPAGAACAANGDCVAGLECAASTCTAPAPVAAVSVGTAAISVRRQSKFAVEHAARSAELKRLTALYTALQATQKPLELEKQALDARLRGAVAADERRLLLVERAALDVRLDALEDAPEVGGIARGERLERERLAIAAALLEDLGVEERARLVAEQAVVDGHIAAIPTLVPPLRVRAAAAAAREAAAEPSR